MRILQNSLLILLGLILVVAIPITATIQSINSTVLKPNTIAPYFKQIGLYQQIEKLVKDNFYEQTADLQEISKIDNLLQKTINENLTDGLIASKVREIENSFWDYFLDKSDTVAPIYFGDFKSSVISSLDSELEELAKEQGLPANLVKENVIKYVESNIPESFNIVNFLDLNNDELSDMKYYYQKEQAGAFYLYILIAVIALLGLLVSFNISKFFKWIGFTFMIASFFLLIPAAFTYFFLNNVLIKRIDFEGISIKLQTSFKALLEMMTGDIAISMFYFISAVLVIGVVALIISSLTKKKSVTNTEAK